MAGPKRRTREFWKKHVEAWRASGESCAGYCRRAGLKPKALSWWKWRLGADGELDDLADEAEPDEDKLPHPFVEVMSVAVDDRFVLEVGAITIRVPANFEADALARVLDVLESR